MTEIFHYTSLIRAKVRNSQKSSRQKMGKLGRLFEQEGQETRSDWFKKRTQKIMIKEAHVGRTGS